MVLSRCFFFCCFFVLFDRAAAAHVVINELYYDHPGADAGYEFVELINSDSLAADLGGVRLEFHNGAGSGWTVVWQAPSGRSIAADGLLVIGGDLVRPLPDVVLSLSLQNGPDAIRLVNARGDVLDLVGYGGLEDSAYVETRAVPSVAAGHAVARAADGVDTDDNAADFVAAAPTPGRRNVARHDVALTLANGTATRSARDAPGVESVGLRVVNLGLEPVPAGAVTLVGRDSTIDGVFEFTGEPNPSVIAPGEAGGTRARVPLGPGYHWVSIRARYGLDERSVNDGVTLLRRASRIPVLVSEIWSAPRGGCPQFVELTNVGGVAVDIGGYSIRDQRARPAILAVDSYALQPGEAVAITSDPAALIACVPDTPASRVIGVRGTWPAFNRSGGAVADSVVALDALGIAVDAIAYPAVGSAFAGRSLERVDLFLGNCAAVWRVSLSAAGASPAIANPASLVEAPDRGVELSPNPFSPHQGEFLRIAMNPATAVAKTRVRIYDLNGRCVADLGAVSAFPALLVWEGRDAAGRILPSGIYVVACEALFADGTRAGVEKVVVGCAAYTN